MSRLIRVLLATLMRRKVESVERQRVKGAQSLESGNKEQADACTAEIERHKRGILAGLELLESDTIEQQ